LNPRGQLPTLKIGDVVLNESMGACLFLEDKFKEQALIPAEDMAKAIVLQRAFEAQNLQKYCNENVIYYIWHTPKEKVDTAHVTEKKKELNTELDRWEQYLTQQNTSHIATEEFSLADVIFFPQLAFVVRMGYPISKFPKLKNYYESVTKRPSIQKTWPPHWINTTNSTLLADC